MVLTWLASITVARSRESGLGEERSAQAEGAEGAEPCTHDMRRDATERRTICVVQRPQIAMGGGVWVGRVWGELGARWGGMV